MYIPCTIENGFVGALINGEYIVRVVQNGAQHPLQHRCLHSPSGFAWGYGGSGPADLAYSILCKLVSEKRAGELYQTFKWEVVANLNEDFWELEVQWIRNWIDQKGD